VYVPDGDEIDAHDTTGTPLVLSPRYVYLVAIVDLGIVSHEPIITVENRWDEKAGLRTGCGVRSQVIDVLRGTRDKGDRQ